MFPPCLTILFELGRASSAVSQAVEKFGDELDVAIDQVYPHRPAGPAAAQVVVKPVDQLVDQQHFFRRLYSFGELIDEDLEQLYHFWTPI